MLALALTVVKRSKLQNPVSIYAYKHWVNWSFNMGLVIPCYQKRSMFIGFLVFVDRFESVSSNDRVVGWWNPANRLALKDLGDTPLSGDPPSPYIIGGCKF